MIVLLTKNNEKLIPKTLFLSIIIMLIPFIICYTLFDIRNMLMPLVAIAYILQIIILSTVFIDSNTKIRGSSLWIAIALLLLQFFAILINSLRDINISSNDYINAISKPLNFLLLFEIMFSVKVYKTQIRYFMEYLTIFSLVACIYNMLINWTEIVNLRYITSSYDVDLRSFFTNRNQFGAFLFIALVANCYICAERKVTLLRISIFILQIFNLVLTMSRGGILACSVFLFILFIQNIKKFKVFITAISICITIICIIVTNNELMNFINNNIFRINMGTTGRTDIWRMGINVAMNNNIISGVGFYTGLQIAESMGFQYSQFHSLFVDAIVDGGIIELIFLICILFYITRRCFRLCIVEKYKKIYRASVTAMWILGIFESVNFFSIGYVDTLYTVFFISIPLLLSNLSIEGKLSNYNNH